MICKYLKNAGLIIRSENLDEANVLQMLAELLPRGRQTLPQRTADVEFTELISDAVDDDVVTLVFKVHEKCVMW